MWPLKTGQKRGEEFGSASDGSDKGPGRRGRVGRKKRVEWEGKARDRALTKASNRELWYEDDREEGDP